VERGAEEKGSWLIGRRLGNKGPLRKKGIDSSRTIKGKSDISIPAGGKGKKPEGG